MRLFNQGVILDALNRELKNIIYFSEQKLVLVIDV